MSCRRLKSSQACCKGQVKALISGGFTFALILLVVQAEARDDIILTKGKLIMRGGKNQGKLRFIAQAKHAQT